METRARAKKLWLAVLDGLTSQAEIEKALEAVRTEAYKAGQSNMRERAAKIVENGRLLHDDASDARFGKSCGAAKTVATLPILEPDHE